MQTDALSGVFSIWAVTNCRVPAHCIDSKRYPLFMAREAMVGLIEQLKASGGSKS